MVPIATIRIDDPARKGVVVWDTDEGKLVVLDPAGPQEDPGVRARTLFEAYDKTWASWGTSAWELEWLWDEPEIEI